jgi:outer membrane receptor for ferrienterochelin and colicins
VAPGSSATRRTVGFFFVLILAARPTPGQPSSGSLLVRVLHGAAPISSADVQADDVIVQTDPKGEAHLTLPEGDHEVRVLRAGFAPAALRVSIQAGRETVSTVQLREERLESTVTVVSSTRSGRVIQDQATRVEAVPQEEIEENQTIAPGSLVTLLNELGGLRMQPIVPALGGYELRLQGLRGRYTQVLTDELPLYGESLDALSLLQATPLDLARVEVIKGAASALYGGSALGGVMNLVSRPPGGETELLLNQTSHGGTDVAAFYPGTMRGRWGMTLLGSLHRQEEEDLDGDGWADLPGARRAVLRPRLFWDDQAGHSLFLTAGGMAENRDGGTVEGGTTPAGGEYPETLRTRRIDGGFVGRFLTEGGRLLSFHGSLARVAGDRLLGTVREQDVREVEFAEGSLAGGARGHTWVLGAAYVGESLHAVDLEDLDYRNRAPGIFVQDEYSASAKLAFSASGRVDFQDHYGTFFSPRVSMLLKPERRLSLRISAGTGYTAPVPFTEKTEEVGLSRVMPLAGVTPEKAQSASMDLGWSNGPLELNGTLFASRVEDALLTRPAPARPDMLEIFNAAEPTRSSGAEILARYSRGALHAIGSYTFLRSTESDPGGSGRREVPLTPRHQAEVAVILENEQRGRVGSEISYTGHQSLEDNPYRSAGVAYVEVNLLGEVRLGEAHLFLNAMNLTDVRQTRFDPLLLPSQAPDGRWTTEVWAPLEGRVFNAGVRMEF